MAIKNNQTEFALKNHDSDTMNHKPFIERSYSHSDIASPTTVVLADGDYVSNVGIKEQLKSTFIADKIVDKPFYDETLFKREDFPPDDQARFGDE